MRKLSAVAATLLFALSVPVMAAAIEYDAGHIPKPEILLPDNIAKALVVLLSDAKGWTPTEEAAAQRLKDNGSIVIGIDTPAYLTELRKDDGECVYMISDIEDLVHQAERSAEMTTYLPPIVAGIGDGGALALAMLAQTPRATIGQTLAVDPQVGIPLLRQLCTPAERTVSSDRMIYGLTAGELPDPLTVVFSSAAPPSGRQHVDRLVATHDDIDVQNLDADAASILSTTLADSDCHPRALTISLACRWTFWKWLRRPMTPWPWSILAMADGATSTVRSRVICSSRVCRWLASIHCGISGRKNTPQQTADDLAKIRPDIWQALESPSHTARRLFFWRRCPTGDL